MSDKLYSDRIGAKLKLRYFREGTMNLQPSPRYLVIQDGSRLHYALPIAIQRSAMLEGVVTDWFIQRGDWLGYLEKLVRLLKKKEAARMSGRRCAELDKTTFYKFTILGLQQHFKNSRKPNSEETFVHNSCEVGDWIIRKVLQKNHHANGLCGFIRNVHPRVWAYARKNKLMCVGDQMIAPKAIELAENVIQQSRFPGWEKMRSDDNNKIMVDIENESWAHLDHITCASNYVKEGLLKQGISNDRISVMPYPIDATHFQPNAIKPKSKAPVVVGFVGSVGLRKGIPYFIEMAKRFDPAQVKFVAVGPIALNPQIIEKYQGLVEFVGAVPRVEVANYFRRFDLYYFPSTCEGSAGSIMEAMAMGIPVVCSPNSGSIIQDGVDGFVRPYDDLDSNYNIIEKLAFDPDYRMKMGIAARTAVEKYSLDFYAAGLKKLYLHLCSKDA